MATVTIEKLKNISRLEFEIPVNGVHVLTGVNGSGKTSLLACLERLAHPNAFRKHFKGGSSTQFDNFSSSQITYSHNGNSVTYIYRETRWAPNPRVNSSILGTLGFIDVVYITSSEERFYVQNQALNTKNITAAGQFFKDSMNFIFQTTKYNDLRRVKLKGKGRGNGRWNYGFILPLASAGGQSRYYTERNFSLGEILVLNALFELDNVQTGSLVLVDEVELALHPKVQVKFLELLQAVADQKNLTVIISTHSSSLIKAAPKLIHLEGDAGGIVSVDYDCFPALALQSVAVEEEIQPDVVLFVEDLTAKDVLEHILSYFFRNVYIGRRPIIKVLAVGGWPETMKLTISSAVYLIPKNTSVYAFLDLDAQITLQNIQANPNRTQAEQEQLNLYNANLAMIKFLPVTPELGVVNLLNNNPNTHITPLRNLFNAVFDIAQIIIDEQARGFQYSPNARKAAKARLDYYVARIKQATNRDVNQVRSMLCEYFANTFGAANHGTLQGLFNPIF